MQILRNVTHGRLFVFISYMLVIAIYCSHFLLSVSLILLALLSILRCQSTPTRLVMNRDFGKAVLGVFKWPFLAFILIYIIHLISWFNSDNTGEYLRHLQVKLPYLALPIIFLNHPVFSRRQYHNFYCFYILVSCVMLGGVLINYVMHFESLTLLISQGGAIPTPLNHTKFSVLLVIALNAGIILAVRNHSEQNKSFKMGLWLAIIFLFIGLHVLAVRSGLACFYISFLVLSVGYLLKRRKYLLIIGMVGCCLLLPYIAYHTIPSFYKKVGYTIYDYSMWKENGGQGYNDSERLRSYEIGVDMVGSNPIFGVGIGDIHDAVKHRYQEKHESGNPRQPHNQFLFSAAAFGMVGLILYVLLYLFPFIWKGAYRDPLLLSFFLILTAFCMIEKPLERSSFIVLHCFLVLYSLRSHHK